MAAVCLETQDLCKTYVVDGYGNNVLQNINLKVEEGEFVSIMGPSGSGKSTLLYVISGMDGMTAGNVIFDGEDLSKMSEKQLTKLRLLKMGFPVLMMSARTDDQSKILGLQIGADDYIEKPFSIQVLGLKIKALLRRAYDLAEDRQLLAYGNLTMDVTTRTVYKDEKRIDVTGKEFDLLEYMMRNPEQIIRKEKLFDEVWGADCFSEVGSLNVHIRWLREKLEDDPKNPKLIASANLFLEAQKARNANAFNLLMNHVCEEVQAQISEALDIAESGDDHAKTPSLNAAQVNSIIQNYLDANKRKLAKEFGSSSMPKKISFLSATPQNDGVALINRQGTSARLWTLSRDGMVIGFLAFEYDEQGAARYAILLNAVLILAFFIALGVCVYVNHKVLSPFGKFAEYPERLSKNQFSDKLPETKNRLFGKFVWGINRLNDKMANDRKRIGELSREHLTMVTTIAHGIKTPVSNIKLYADAIESGLYQPDGIVNESDAEVARKISKNADDVTNLVKTLIDKASSGVVDFEPEIKSFYLNDLKKFLEEEYGRRLELLKIPHSFEVERDAIMKSDKNGICRILPQLVENAIKYGNGEGISVRISKEADGYHVSVKNKGKVLNDQELPYVFNSFWRGSNAEGIEGSGIGLFEAYEIARRLDGDIYVRTNAERNEMEFHLTIE